MRVRFGREVWSELAMRYLASTQRRLEVIIRSRADSNDLIFAHLHARVNRFNYIAQLSQLSSARSRLGQRQLEELLVLPRYQAPLRATTASNSM